MKKLVTLMLAMTMAVHILPASAATPIYVDGSGNGIAYGSAEEANAANGDTEGSYDYGDYEGGFDYELPTDEEEEIDPNAPQKWEYDPSVMTAAWGNRRVEVLSLGTVVSVIRLGRINVEVYTRELTFAPDIPDSRKLAFIRAPRNAQASMRKRPSAKSAIIMKCQTSRIVPVLDIVKGYAKVHYEDAVGYVPLNCLTFVPASEETAVMAYVAMNGNLRSRNTVNARQEDNAQSRVLDEVQCGQRVAVISVGDKFTEIEVDSLRCFVLNEWLVYLTEEESRQVPRVGIYASLHAGMATLSDIP